MHNGTRSYMHGGEQFVESCRFERRYASRLGFRPLGAHGIFEVGSIDTENFLGYRIPLVPLGVTRPAPAGDTPSKPPLPTLTLESGHASLAETQDYFADARKPGEAKSRRG